MGAANGAMMGREQRQRRIMARMPDEVAEVMERRLEHRELKEKINYEAAMFKRQENFDEFTNNPVHHMLGLGRKPPPKQPDEESSAESWFMKKKIAERDKLDWEDPVKKAMRRTDACEDQGKHLIKLTCNYATGYEIIESRKTPYKVKSHFMAVEELKVSDLFDLHFIFKEKLESWMFFCKSVRDWPMQPDHIEPSHYDTIILQFKAGREEFKHKCSIEQKIIDRYRFLRLLFDLDLTECTEKRIDLGWNPNGDDPITYEEEPLLRQFEAKQVLHYYEDLDSSPEKKDRRVDVTKVGRISLKDAFRIIMTSIISEATEYAPLVAPASTHSCNNATAMEKMKKKRQQAAERLEAKSVGKLGRMRGPKQDMRQVVQKVSYVFETKFRPALDDVAFFEFSSFNGERLMRRNAAWEFCAQMDSIDLVRAMRLVLEIPTLRQDLTGWTSESSNAGTRAAQKGGNAGLEAEEEQHYNLARWLRQRVIRAARNFEIKQTYQTPTALDIAKNKKKGRESIKNAQERTRNAQERTGKAQASDAAAELGGGVDTRRKVEAIVYPALAERQRRQKEDGLSDLQRAQGKAWKLLDSLESMDD